MNPLAVKPAVLICTASFTKVQGVKAFFILFAPQSRASGGTGGHLSKHLVTGGLDVGACVLFAAPPFPHLLSRIVIRPPCPTSS